MANVAFIGTGLLGSGMVEAMLGRGERVTVWNRSSGKAEALAAFGAIVTTSPELAVKGADRVHLALADDRVVDEMLVRIGPAIASQTLVIDHTTTAPTGTAPRVADANRRGMKFLHAPVFMSPQMCRDAVGLMLVAGPQAVFDAARSALEPMTGEVWYVGERPDLAAVYKIFGNALLFAITAGITDILAMARNLDVPPLDAAGLFSKFKIGGVIAQRAEKIARGDFTATFELTMARKDIRLMIEAAGKEPLTVLPSLAKRMDEAIANGYGTLDMGAITKR